MIRPWDRQPGESHKAYAAFEFVYKNWPRQNVAEAYREFYGKPDAKKPSGRWYQWVRDYHWNERLEAYDQWRQEEKQRAQMEAAGEAYQAELETYRRMHEQAGKAAFNAVVVCNRILQAAATEMVNDPEKHPKTYTELSQLSTVIGNFMRYAPDVWAAALGIPDIQAQIEANGKKE